MTNIHCISSIFPTGPSTQTNIAMDRVVFGNVIITFPSDGPFRQRAYAQIIDDAVALEADESVRVELTVESPSSGVMFSDIPTTVVRIVDNDRKPSVLIAVMRGCLVLCGEICFVVGV